MRKRLSGQITRAVTSVARCRMGEDGGGNIDEFLRTRRLFRADGMSQRRCPTKRGKERAGVTGESGAVALRGSQESIRNIQVCISILSVGLYVAHKPATREAVAQQARSGSNLHVYRCRPPPPTRTLSFMCVNSNTNKQRRRCCRTMFFGRALAQAPSSHAHNPNPIHIPKRVGMCAIPGRRETQVSIPSLLHRALVWS